MAVRPKPRRNPSLPGERNRLAAGNRLRMKSKTFGKKSQSLKLPDGELRPRKLPL